VEFVEWDEVGDEGAAGGEVGEEETETIAEIRGSSKSPPCRIRGDKGGASLRFKAVFLVTDLYLATRVEMREEVES
jgi:hypothetical protein